MLQLTGSVQPVISRPLSISPYLISEKTPRKVPARLDSARMYTSINAGCFAEKGAAMIREVIRRCPYCKREASVTARAYSENPFCQECLDERVSRAPRAPENEIATLDGRYFVFSQEPQKAD